MRRGWLTLSAHGRSSSEAATFQENWIPFLGLAQAFLMFELPTDGSGPTAVASFEVFDSPVSTPRTATVSGFVDRCHDMLDTTLWVWDPFDMAWEYHYEETPSDLRWLNSL